MKKPVKRKTITHWKELEDEVQNHLKLAQRARAVMFHRLSDTRAAGNYVAEQPADFWALSSGRFSLIEAKFSKIAESLKSCFSSSVSDGQLASARLAVRAGGSYWILFHSQANGLFEVWPGAYCAERRSESRQLELPRRRTFPDLDQALDHILFPSGA